MGIGAEKRRDGITVYMDGGPVQYSTLYPLISRPLIGIATASHRPPRCRSQCRWLGGWRQSSRELCGFATKSPPHLAGSIRILHPIFVRHSTLSSFRVNSFLGPKEIHLKFILFPFHSTKSLEDIPSVPSLSSSSSRDLFGQMSSVSMRLFPKWSALPFFAHPS